MATNSKLHIVVFPWLAFGHMIPFLDLAKHIAQKGHKISFISTPKNIQRLPKPPPSLSPLINFIQLSLPRIQNLPENAEATMDLPPTDVYLLKDAFDGLETELTQFLESSTPDWIIYDFAPYWLPPIVHRLNIKSVFFTVLSAWFSAFLGPADVMVEGPGEVKDVNDLTVPPKWIPFPSNLAFRKYQITRSRETAAKFSKIRDTFRVGTVIKGCDVFTLRYCSEFEGKWLDLLGEIQQKPVIPLGFMAPFLEKDSEDDSDESDEKWVVIKNWLDEKNEGSVVYVALGSEAALSQDELNELAIGLELSGLPFFWVLRKPPGSNETDSVELPDGFEDRTKGQGVVWKSWAPQVKILSHESIGGFLTHCGYSSIIEGLAFGRALIMLPMVVDQGLIARILVETNVGLEIERDENDGSFTRHSVAETVKTVVVAENGKVYRDKAKEMSMIFGNKDLQNRYMENFIEYLENHI